MGYKEIGKNLGFADLAVEKSLEHNRSLKMMEKINAVVHWKNIEAVLLEHYDVGKSKEGGANLRERCSEQNSQRPRVRMANLVMKLVGIGENLELCGRKVEQVWLGREFGKQSLLPQRTLFAAL